MDDLKHSNPRRSALPRRAYRSDISGECWLYRLFDADGRLLYVGVTNDVGRRLRDHRHTKPWWPEVATYTAERQNSRAGAFYYERDAIINESPAYNIVRRSN